MADQNLNVDCKERVAFDLMKAIDFIEGQASQKSGQQRKVDRDHVLTLYRQCYKAVTGSPLEDILGKD